MTFHLRIPDPDLLYKLATAHRVRNPGRAHPLGTSARTRCRPPGPTWSAASYPAAKLTLVRNPRFHEWSKAAQPDGYPEPHRGNDRQGRDHVRAARDQIRAAERGKIDLAFDVPPALQRRGRTPVRQPAPRQIRITASTYLFLNTKAPPFDDVRVRRAVSYAADRAAGARASRCAPWPRAPTCPEPAARLSGYEPYCPYTAGRHATRDVEGTRPRPRPPARRGVGHAAACGMHGLGADEPLGEGPFAGQAPPEPRVSRAVPQREYGGLLARRLCGPPAACAGRAHVVVRRIPVRVELHRRVFFACNVPSRTAPGSAIAAVRTANPSRTRVAGDGPARANKLWAALDRAIVDRAPMVPLFALKEIDVVSPRVGNYEFSPRWGVLAAPALGAVEDGRIG